MPLEYLCNYNATFTCKGLALSPGFYFSCYCLALNINNRATYRDYGRQRLWETENKEMMDVNFTSISSSN